ncbi:MAG TPA: hypothetical protein VN429_09385 [Methanospirillum sp.]|uniref:hypothetical protein n=1 Tax=Methanospirillum sp. TaxID=45200 RepID=UPI002B65330D|nr:hypothetical protein [Methanospirillum sp.]HWQ64615.1 hypothetical protein [Methanospirillum sp.]
MQIKSFHLLFLITLILVSGTASAISLKEHTTEEWQSILAIPDNSTMLTGLQITLAIRPNLYYLPQGSEVNISGKITTMFGPIKNAPIILARGNGTIPAPAVNLTTDDNGDFSLTDHLNSSGVVRYQAWFEGSDLKGKNLTKSYEIEITTVANSTEQKFTNLTVQEEPEQSIVEPEEIPESDATLNESDIKQISDTSGLILHGPESYISGENVTFSGSIIGKNQTPLPFVALSIQKRGDNGQYSKIGDTITTGADGSFTTSYYLTGPETLSFRALSTDDLGKDLTSNVVTLQFEKTEDFAPMARDRTGIRNIDAGLNAAIIKPDENVTISGWFSDGEGNGVASGRLNLYWYNFADKIWDRYRNTSEAITNDDGYYAFNVSGPNLTGISYLAVVSKKEQTGKPLFSHVLPLVVRGQTETNSSILPAVLTVKSEPPEVQVNEKALITFTLSDPDGNPLAEEPVQMYFSEDGFTWFMNGNGNLTTRSDGTVAMVDVPKKSGFHYYRGVYGGSDFFGPADSGILALIITGPENGAGNPGSENMTQENKTE